MAKKNETKSKKTATVAADVAADVEVAVAAEQTAENEKPADEAEVQVKKKLVIDDDPTQEAVTVIVLLTRPQDDALLLRHSLRSIEKNLRGVAADVRVVGKQRPEWLAEEAWLMSDDPLLNLRVKDVLPLVKTERVVVMTDRMFLIRPVSLADIAVRKADLSQTETTKMLIEQQGTTKHEVFNFDTLMPVLLCATPLRQILDYLTNEVKVEDFDLPTVYFNLLAPELRPLIVDWRNDDWLLPVVSSSPNKERINRLLARKKFLYFYPQAEGEAMVSLLKFLTPDASQFETVTTNADPVED